MKDEVTRQDGHRRRRDLSFGHGYGVFRAESLCEWHYAQVQDGTAGLGKFNSKHILSTYYVLGTLLVAGMHSADQS